MIKEKVFLKIVKFPLKTTRIKCPKHGITKIKPFKRNTAIACAECLKEETK